MARHSIGFDERADGVNVDLLILAFVVLCVGSGGELSGDFIPRVPSCYVGADAKDLLGAPRGLVDGGKHIGAGLEIGVPA